jgi:2-polyprenyl-6-methoxyphenol hydroxylase-like FAD-dependent oxidoreductase
MQADAKLHATQFPEDTDFFRGVLRAMRASKMAHMSELQVRFCANPHGGAPNYEVSTADGEYAHCYASTHSSYPDAFLEIPEPEFDPKLLGRKIYQMEDIQDMLRERIERQGNVRRREPAKKTELRKTLEALFA